jgi:ABC-2 type transport system ATP-binding protein
MTVLVTTHYMDEAEQSCDRVALMHRGHIRAVGTPPELIASLDAAGPATLDEVFRVYAGDDWDEETKGLSNVRQTRRTAARLG